MQVSQELKFSAHGSNENFDFLFCFWMDLIQGTFVLIQD